MKLSITADLVRLRGGTMVLIKAGPINLAKAVLGGRWSREQALNELKRNTKRFEMISPDSEKILKSLGAI